MDVFAFSSAASAAGNFPLFPSSGRLRRNRENLSDKPKKKFIGSASKMEESKLNEWDQMELKFGSLLGEDPKLTLAKIVARKVNPDASFVEVEKSFYKNKGKIPDIETIPLDWSKEEKKKSTSLDGLNLVKPVLKNGVKFKDDMIVQSLFRFYRVSEEDDMIVQKISRDSAMDSNPKTTSETVRQCRLDILYHMSASFSSFVAKRSVGRFPLVGFISKCLGCVYVQREAKSPDFKGVFGTVNERVREAHRNKSAPTIMPFPEGTTTNGDHLLTFKTGAFLAGTPDFLLF